MSIRQRLLVVVDDLLAGMVASDSCLDSFVESFTFLLAEVEQGIVTGALSLEEQQLAFEVATMIDKMASGLEELEMACEEALVDLRKNVEGEINDFLLASHIAGLCSPTCLQNFPSHLSYSESLSLYHQVLPPPQLPPARALHTPPPPVHRPSTPTPFLLQAWTAPLPPLKFQPTLPSRRRKALLEL